MTIAPDELAEAEIASQGPRIESIELFVLPLPKFKPFTTAYGTLGAPHVFVRVEAEGGHVGWGDTGHFDAAYAGERWETALINAEYLAKASLGRNAFALGPLHALWDGILAGNPQAKCALDLALYDLVSRAKGMLLCDFLGGARVERLEVELNVPIGTREEVLKDIQRALDFGVRTLGTKAGRPTSPSIEHDVANFTAIRDTFGYDFDLWIDFNAGSTRTEAVQAIKTLEQFKLGQVEQPVAGWDLDGLAFVAEQVDTPVVADEPIIGAQSVLLVAEKNAADVIHAKLPKTAGIHGARKMAAVCEALNLPMTMAGFGLANYCQAALMHFLVTEPICHLYPHKLRAGELTYPDDVSERPVWKHGAFQLPRRTAGVGLEMDEEKLRRLATESRRFRMGASDGVG
jgi:L-alanine-DL-glutamate epimerase-like enolase superfamily enzyme